MSRLSPRQREILQMVATACEPRNCDLDDGPKVVPFYMPNTNIFFDTLSEQVRFFDRLASRGFVTVRNRAFVNITEAGTKALATKEQRS